MTTEVIRFVVTHLGKDGVRTLVGAQQGHNTYTTPEEAQAWIDAAKTDARTIEILGPELEVRQVACWPGHFDPKTCWFDS